MRAILYFLVGFLLSVVVVLSHAETIGATATASGTDLGYAVHKNVWADGLSPHIQYGDPWTNACTAMRQTRGWTQESGCSDVAANPQNYSNGGLMGSCRDNHLGYCGGGGDVTSELNCPSGSTLNTTTLHCITNTTTYSCPTTGGWTLSGTSCTRPDCQAGETRDPTTGVCTSVCTSKKNAGTEYGWYSKGKTDDISGTYCDGQCNYTLALDTGTSEYFYTATTITMRYGKSYDGTTCQASTAPNATANAADKSPASPPKNPPCGATEGVLTSSSGTVACVPAGTPSSEMPKTSTTKKTETFSDGSTKTTTTTTTEAPSTGVTSSSTTTTTTGATGGGTGQAGTPGTSTSGTSTSKDTTGGTDPSKKSEGSDACDPTVAMCGSPGTGDLYTKKGKTVSGSLTTFSNGFKASPIGAAMTGFFTVTVPSGSCPDMSVSVEFLNVNLNLSPYFCSPDAVRWMDVAGWVIFALACFVAFRWAIL